MSLCDYCSIMEFTAFDRYSHLFEWLSFYIEFNAYDGCRLGYQFLVEISALLWFLDALAILLGHGNHLIELIKLSSLRNTSVDTRNFHFFDK